MKRRLLSGLGLVLTLISHAQFGDHGFQFIENKGQWETPVKFKGELSTGAFFIHTDGFTVLMHDTSDLKAIRKRQHAHGNGERHQEGGGQIGGATLYTSTSAASLTLHSHAYRVRFEGANPNAAIIPSKADESYNNYYIGNDPNKWASNVRMFGAITIKNIYPNIDLRYYAEAGSLKYDWIIYPGGNPQKIVVVYDGAEKVSVQKKELLIQTSVGTVTELYPYSYQSLPEEGKVTIDCQYVVGAKNSVRFKLKKYDPTQTLVIDPTLIFCSFTGGADNWGFTATPGPDGSLFSGSITFSDGFPTTTGAFKTTFSGGSPDTDPRPGVQTPPTDIGIIKFNPTGTKRLFATYIGGSLNEFPHSLYCDVSGNLVVMGRTYSTDYPGKLVGTGGLCDILVTKLNASGNMYTSSTSATGISSMRIGGGGDDGVNISDVYMVNGTSPNTLMQFYGDESRSEVILDPAGNIYVASNTQSSNFPNIGSLSNNNFGGQQDGVLLKIDPGCTQVLWSRFIGGANDDGAYVLETNPITGDIYVGGATASNTFPGDRSGATDVKFKTFQGGICDGFITIVTPAGAIGKSAFLGTTKADVIYGVKFDKNGFPYVMGITRGTWPTTVAAIGGAGSKQFVAKLEPDLKAYVFSTVFGNGDLRPTISPVAFAVDRCDNMYISGWGGWVDSSPDPFDMGSIVGMPIGDNSPTKNILKSTTDRRDMYFIVISKNATGFEYGSYFGQNGGEGEHVDGGTSRFDERGTIYQAICANCYGYNAGIPLQSPGFPTYPKTGSNAVVAPYNGTGNRGCNLAAVKLAFNFAGVGAGPKSFLNGVPRDVVCVGTTLELKDMIGNAQSWNWTVQGDANTYDLSSISYTFNNVGTFKVTLTANDPNTCNLTDTKSITITVRDNPMQVKFTHNRVLDPPSTVLCTSLRYEFDNTSFAPNGPLPSTTSFTWDFNDGSAPQKAGLGITSHKFPAPGTYKVRLYLDDLNYCNAPAYYEEEVRIASTLTAKMETPAKGCAPYDLVAENTSDGGQSFVWKINGIIQSTNSNLTAPALPAGSYIIEMTATDAFTCNTTSTVTKTVTVADPPMASFTFAPITPVKNTPTTFTNGSTTGITYKWDFGDGETKTTTDYAPIKHQYNISGSYNSCLTAINNVTGCTAVYCEQVEANVDPLFDIPNAFTPGRFGSNSEFKIAGYGILSMRLSIFNRWGVKVFETSTKNIGWDGTYNGKPQPMDVYTYVLDIELIDGTKKRRTGDISLIR